MNTSAFKITSKKGVAVILVVAVLVAAGLLVDRQKSRLAADKPVPAAPVSVTAQLLARTHLTLTLPLVADVQAVQEANIASRLTAYVTELRYLEGDRVKKGDVLVRLDKAEAESLLQRAQSELTRTRLQQGTLTADLTAAKAAADTARDRAARSQSLYDIQGVSKEQLQSEQSNQVASQARLIGAQAAVGAYQAGSNAAQTVVQSAQANLSYAEIRAPFDGIVAARALQVGDLATPGKPLLRLVGLGEQRLLITLPEAVQPQALRWQDKDLPLKPWPEAQAQGMRRYEARATGLTPGTRVSVKLLTFNADALLLPDACLLNDDGHNATVFQLPEDGVAKPLKVQLAALGSEGAASLDARLNGITIACGGADVLTRLAVGVPYRIATGR